MWNALQQQLEGQKFLSHIVVDLQHKKIDLQGEKLAELERSYYKLSLFFFDAVGVSR